MPNEPGYWCTRSKHSANMNEPQAIAKSTLNAIIEFQMAELSSAHDR